MKTCSAGAATGYRLAGGGVENDCIKRAGFPFRLILFNYFFAIFLCIVSLSACMDHVIDGGLISDKDTYCARRRFSSCQNATFHRVRARDGRWLCAVAVEAGCSTRDRR